jgi:predicted RNase H-like nuclease (RuvC/YqgF family)
MAKGEKVKTDSKSSPPPSDESEMDSSDESSDEEANQLVSDMDKQSTDFIASLIVELEKCQDTLRFERSELESLHLEVSQAESVIATLKEDLAASQAQCNSLKSMNEELEEQYSLLWSSTSHPLEVKCDSSASTSKGCDKCYNIDLESYATNLANMEALKKEIARLNSIIARGCMSEGNKKGKFSKRKISEISEKPGFGYVEGGKTNERKIIKEKECLEFKSTGFLFAQTLEVSSSKPGGSGVWKPRATQTGEPRRFRDISWRFRGL